MRIWGDLARVRVRHSGSLPIPEGISRLIPMKPFEEPFLRSSHIVINRNRGFALHVLFHSHLSQDFFFHRVTSWVGLIRNIINQPQSQGNRCIGIKTDIKGNLCIATSGLPMYWHLATKAYFFLSFSLGQCILKPEVEDFSYIVNHAVE
jgi:hypothetical protein